MDFYAFVNVLMLKYILSKRVYTIVCLIFRMQSFLCHPNELILIMFEKNACRTPENSKVFDRMICSRHDTSLVLRKPVFGVSNQVRHKSGCTATEDG